MGRAQSKRYVFAADRLRRGELFRFIGIGVANTAVTYALYLLLLRFLPYWIAYTVTYVCGILISYALNATIVFRQSLRLTTALKYPLVYAAQYLFGIVALYVLVEICRINRALAPLIVVSVTVPITYVLSRYVIVPRT